MKKLEERSRGAAVRAERVRKAVESKAREEAARLERQREAKAQAKLQTMGVCVAGFRWIKQSKGYRCAGGAHFVTNAELGLRETQKAQEKAQRETARALEEEREAAARAERARKVAELKAREEAERLEGQREEMAQAKLQTMGVCVAGFPWIKQLNGYQCGGGSHFVTNAELGL